MLPKIQLPTTTIFVPSLKRGGKFRPFTVKEEKILLLAKESDEPEVDYLRAIHQIVSNCLQDSDINSEYLTTFDLEWLFLKLREISVGPTVSQSFNDIEEKNLALGDPQKLAILPTYDFEIKLSDVKAPEVPEGKNIIEIPTGGSIELRYPPASLYTNPEYSKHPQDAMLWMSTVSIKDENGVAYDPSKEEMSEVISYYDSLDVQTMGKIKDFFSQIPSMSYECEYQNSLDHQRKIRLSTLTDFFTF